MITQDFINGYVQSLNNIKDAAEAFIAAEEELLKKYPLKTTSSQIEARIEAFEQVIQYIDSVKDSYKQLVKKLNKDSQ